VIHTFGGDLPPAIELPVPGPREVVAAFAGAATAKVRDGVFEYRPDESYEGAAYLLRPVRSQA